MGTPSPPEDPGTAEAVKMDMKTKPATKPSLEQIKSLGLCTYCGNPTRKGSALIDGYAAHKSCIAEFEGAS
jgi:hypothetical protein